MENYLITHEETYLLPEGKTITFALSLPLVEIDDEDAEVACHILVSDEKRVLQRYFRRFPLRRWHDAHFDNFVKKCVSDPVYLSQFSTLPCNKTIPDPEMKEIVEGFKKAGFPVLSSCQGTRDPVTDKPIPTDGHANRAFIRFKKVIPWLLLDYLRPHKHLVTSPHCITVRHRKYNPEFIPTMHLVLEEWERTGS